MLEAGAPLPDVTAPDQSGSPVRLRDLAGAGTLVIYFYPKADTPGCTTESRAFGELYPRFREKGVEIVGVSRDTPEAQTRFKERYELPFRLLADTDSTVCDAFGVIVEKNMYGKTSVGIQRSTFLVRDGAIARVWKRVSVEGHADEVLASV